MTPQMNQFFRKWLPLAVWLALAATGTQAQENAQAVSLQECLQYTVAHSTQVRRAQLEAQRGAQQVKELTAQGLPQVSANAQFNYNPTLQVIFFPDFLNGNPDVVSPVTIGTHWGASGAITLNQLAYSPSYNVAKRAVRSSAELYQLLVEKSEGEVLLEAAKMYYSVQMVAQQRALVQANLDQVDRLLELSRLQVANGFGRPVEVDQLTVNRINLENQLSNLELVYQQQLNMLKFTMQLPPDQAIVLTDTLSESYEALSLSTLEPNFLNRVDFAVLDKQRELYNLNLTRYRAEYLPTVNLNASLNALAQPATFADFGKSRSWADFSSIGLSIQIPIFDGFRRRSLMEQVKIDLLQNVEDRRYAERAFDLRYRNARLSLQSNLNNLAPLRQNRALAEQVYQQAQNRFREGVAPITEVVNAETAMREAQANLLLALFQVKISELELLDANGSLRQMIQ